MRNYINRLRFALPVIGLLAAVLLLRQYAVPATANIERPNIIVILTDDQDIDSLAAMRKLLSFPEGSWTNFTNAFINDSICCSSRATILTGQYAHNTGVMKNNQGMNLDDKKTVAVWLDNAGYETAMIGKYLNGFPWNKGLKYVPPGWDFFRAQRDLPDTSVDAFTRLGLDFINRAEAPFFLYLSYMAPHYPATPPERYKNVPVNLPPVRPNVNEADVSDKPGGVNDRPLLTQPTLDLWRKEQANFYREVMAIDDGVQAIVDALKAKGELDNTMIIFLSDNGMSWGSHRKIGKWCPYEECSLVPFLIRYPEARGNRTETRFVTNVDLAATIAEYAGVQPTQKQDGRSLMPLLRNNVPNWDNAVLLERHVGNKYYGIRVENWKYVEYRLREEELYDLVNDPYELDNLANTAEGMNKQIELAGRLHRLLGLNGVSGFVYDENGRPVERALVSIDGTRKDYTNQHGWYSIRELRPGIYSLKISKSGYKFTPKKLTFTINGNDVTQDFYVTR